MRQPVLWALALMPVWAGAATAIADAIPDAIKVPPGHQAFLTVHGKGWQIYACDVEQGRPVWKVQAPDMRLVDDNGQTVGQHLEGPLWRYRDGSQLRGKIIARHEAAPGRAIAWLLVRVIGGTGKGPFSAASYINRINTVGGLPPAHGCDGNHLGTEARVRFQADYVFYLPIQAGQVDCEGCGGQ